MKFRRPAAADESLIVTTTRESPETLEAEQGGVVLVVYVTVVGLQIM